MLASSVDGDNRVRRSRTPVAYAGEIRGTAQRCGAIGEPHLAPGPVHALSSAPGRRGGRCSRRGRVVKSPTSRNFGETWGLVLTLSAGKYELISVRIPEYRD